MKAFNVPLFLIVVVTTLQAMDILLTYYGLKMGLTELNPFYAEVVIIPKIALPSISYLFYLFLSSYLDNPEKGKAMLIFNVIWILVLVLYIIVICHNIYLITRIQNAAK